MNKMGENTYWKKGKSTNKLPRKVGLAVLFTVAFALFAVVWDYGFTNVKAADSNDFSLYSRASEVATSFGSQMAPDEESSTPGESSWTTNLSSGNAGGLLGYSRSLDEDEDGATGWLTSQLSTSSATYSYDQLNKIDSKLYQYAKYGASLDALGLIETRSDGAAPERFIIGWLMVIIYWFTSLVPLIFSTIMKLLVFFNPFRLFGSAVVAVDAATSNGGGMLSGAINLVSKIYTAIQSISLVVVVPLLIGFTIMGIFMFKGSASKGVGRLVLRLFMMFAGLPLIGATYTSVITDMGTMSVSGSQFADYLVFSQFVDFEGWVKTSRLAPPTENPIIGSTGGRLGSVNATRAMVFEINGTRVYGYSGIYSAIGNGKSGSSIGNIIAENKNSNPEAQTYNNQTALGLLERYRKNESYNGSDYEGFVKSQIDNSMRKAAPDATTISTKAFYKMFGADAGALSDETKGYESAFDRSSGTLEDARWTIYNSGSLTYTKQGDNSYIYGLASPYVRQLNGESASPVGTSGLTDIAGLSPLSMYNFLNTSFGQSNMKVYSSTNSSSGFTRESHASVVKANKGMFGIVGILETFALMLVLSVVGFIYAIGLLQIVMASIPRIMTSVFGTAVGSMASITKLLVTTVVLIVEIIGTVLLYQVTESLVLGMLQFADKIIDSSPGIVSAFAGMTTQIVVILLSVAVGFFSVKNRSKFTKMMEEIVTNTITKLMGGLDSTVNQGNAFHDSGAVGNAAQSGRVFGDNGQLGTQGSGSHTANAKNGGSGSGEGILDKMKGAHTDALNAKMADDRNPNTPQMSAKDVMGGTAARFKKRMAAGIKDGVVNGTGGLGSAALAMMGVSETDGHATEREAKNEEAELKAIEAGELGYGPNADQNRNGILDGQETIDESGRTGTAGPSYINGQGKDGVTTGSGNSFEQELDADGNAIDLDNPVEAMNVDQFNNFMDESNEPLGDVYDGMDDETKAVFEQDGDVNASQVLMGSVDEAVAISANEPGYSSEDALADEAMVEAITQSGESASSVDMDDPTSHPDLEPMSGENDKYINGLGVAVEKQSASAKKHAMKAQELEKQAKKMDKEASLLEAEGSPESLAKAKELRGQAVANRTEADAEKKQGRQAIRKAQKLDAKQQSAQAIRQNAMKSLGKTSSKPVEAGKAYAKATSELAGLTSKAAGLRSELKELDAVDGKNRNESLISQKSAQLRDVEQGVSKARGVANKAESRAIAALPDDGYENLRGMSAAKQASYQADLGLSDAEMSERIDQEPTSAERSRAQKNAAMMLGKMGEKVGSTPAETKQMQESFANERVSQAYNKPYSQAMDKLADAQQNLQDLQVSGASAKEIAQAESTLKQSIGKVQSVDRERKTFGQTMAKGQASNQQQLSGQVRQMEQAQKTDALQAQRTAQNDVLAPLPSKSNDQQNAHKLAVDQVHGARKSLDTLKKNGASVGEVKRASKTLQKAQNRVKAVEKAQAKVQPVKSRKATSSIVGNLAPTVSNGGGYASPELQSSSIDAKGSVVRKRQALSEQQISTPKQYAEKMTALDKSVESLQLEHARVGGRLKAANAQHRIGDAGKLRTQQRRIGESLKQAKQNVASTKATMKANVAGLYSKGFSPSNPIVSTRPITADMDQTTRAAQEYAKIHRQTESLGATLTDSSSPADKARHKQMSNQVVNLRNQLVTAGLRKDSLMKTSTSGQVAEALTNEWSDARNGKGYGTLRERATQLPNDVLNSGRMRTQARQTQSVRQNTYPQATIAQAVPQAETVAPTYRQSFEPKAPTHKAAKRQTQQRTVPQAKGFQPKRSNITMKPITASIPETARTLKAYSMVQKRMEKLTNTMSLNPSPADKMRHEQLGKQIKRMRGDLTSAGINPNRLKNSQSSSAVANELSSEWAEAQNIPKD